LHSAPATALLKVDQAFTLHFSKDDFTSSDIAAFIDNVKPYSTVIEYTNGLVRYLHGVMAKERRSDSMPFEEFDTRFNQAVQSLQDYRTGLCMGVRAVIRPSIGMTSVACKAAACRK